MIEVFSSVLGSKMSKPTELKTEHKNSNFTSVHGPFPCQSRSQVTSCQKLRYFLVPFLQTRSKLYRTMDMYVANQDSVLAPMPGAGGKSGTN